MHVKGTRRESYQHYWSSREVRMDWVSDVLFASLVWKNRSWMDNYRRMDARLMVECIIMLYFVFKGYSFLLELNKKIFGVGLFTIIGWGTGGSSSGTNVQLIGV